MTNRYQALIQERADLIQEAKGIFEAAGSEALTDEQKKRDDEINARLEILGSDANPESEIGRLARIRRAELNAPVASDEFTRIHSMHNRIEDDPMRGFNSDVEFFRAVYDASLQGNAIDERLLIGANAATHTGNSGEYGYLAPVQMSSTIFEIMHQENSLLSLVDLEPTSLGAVQKTTDESTPWGSDSIQARWRDEAAEMTPSKKPKPKKELMELHQLYVFVRSTEELRQDAPRLQNRLLNKSAVAFDWKINKALFEDDGVGKPLGWMKSNALVTQTKEDGQAANTFVAENVAKMYSRCIDKTNAIWFINEDVFPEIITMSLNGRSIWTPTEAGFKGSPGGTLLGRPVRFSEHCETLGTKGDIQLISPKGYYAIARGTQPEFAESMHLYFDRNEMAFRWTFRFNGQPHMSKPVTPNKGTATRSHFIALETRS